MSAAAASGSRSVSGSVLKKKHIKCSECPQIFVQNKHLYAHLRKIHDKEPDIKKPTPAFKCDVCGKLFSLKLTLQRHNKNFHAPFETQEHQYHRESQALKRSKLHCPAEGCSTRCIKYEELRTHLQSKHDLATEMDTFEFNSLEDFQSWKDEIQIKTVSCYTQETGSKSLKNNIQKKYFNCHRSYKYEPSGKNIRALKHVGSNKIGKACPSRMEVTLELNGEQITNVHVKFWKTHHGHTAELGHVPLDKRSRAEIAGKLQQGASFNHILDSIRDTDAQGNERLYLIGNKDLHNIVRDFKLDYVTKQHQNVDDEKATQINESHKCSISITTDMIKTVVENKEWLVMSSNLLQEYYVTYVQEMCSTLCLCCTSCNICIHSFQCSCTDNVIKMSICKHIHACARTLYLCDTNDTSIVACEETIEYEVEDLLDVSQDNVNCITNREEIIKSADLLIDLAGKTTLTDQSFEIIQNHLNKCIDILNKEDTINFLTTENVNVQQKVDKQIHLYSTRRKRTNKNVQMSL